VLGFSNRWYRAAHATALDHRLSDGTWIRLISPALFVATKLEAWLGRGRGDVLTSRDVEDIVTLFDGRSTLPQEIVAADPMLRAFIAAELCRLQALPEFMYLLQSTAGDHARYRWLMRQIQTAATPASDAS
jgi:hypothetical protein